MGFSRPGSNGIISPIQIQSVTPRAVLAQSAFTSRPLCFFSLVHLGARKCRQVQANFRQYSNFSTKIPKSLVTLCNCSIFFIQFESSCPDQVTKNHYNSISYDSIFVFIRRSIQRPVISASLPGLAQISFPIATAASAMRHEKPHSLSYHDITRTSVPSKTFVSSMWKTELCGSWLKSTETLGSFV